MMNHDIGRRNMDDRHEGKQSATARLAEELTGVPARGRFDSKFDKHHGKGDLMSSDYELKRLASDKKHIDEQLKALKEEKVKQLELLDDIDDDLHESSRFDTRRRSFNDKSGANIRRKLGIADYSSDSDSDSDSSYGKRRTRKERARRHHKTSSSPFPAYHSRGGYDDHKRRPRYRESQGAAYYDAGGVRPNDYYRDHPYSDFVGGSPSSGSSSPDELLSRFGRMAISDRPHYSRHGAYC